VNFSSLDAIVKGVLSARSYPIHYYRRALKFSSDCVREISFDDLKIVHSKQITTTASGAVNVPCDFVDWIRVGIINGQYLKPLNQSKGFNRMDNYDSGGHPIDWPVTNNTSSDAVVFGVPFLSWYTNSYNARGENTGGLYGYVSDGSPMTFEYFAEKGQIQLNQALGATSIVLDYIGDGRSLDNASKINPYAEAVIESYIDWKFAANNRNVSGGEKEDLYRKYVRQREILRARMNDMDTNGVMNIFRKNYQASVKS